MVRRVFIIGLLALFTAILKAGEVDALLVVTADQHSSYEKTAQFVARVKTLRRENPAVPLAVLIDGDTFEGGNAVAQRSGGAIEFAMFAELAKCAPTILNIGNHETEFGGFAETIAKIKSTGVIVISNAIDRTTGELFTPAAVHLRLGSRDATVIGIATDHLATYRVAVRPTVDLTNPTTWARENFPAILKGVDLTIVMSHAGIQADRTLFSLVPSGTLFVGAHDHLRLIDESPQRVYFQSGSWNECVSIARLSHSSKGSHWDVEQSSLQLSDPVDSEIAALIRRTMDNYLAPADRQVVGTSQAEMAPAEAAHFVVDALRRATGADMAMVGATTFGAGLPFGSVTAFQLHACVRFDSAIDIAEIEGSLVAKILSRSNQGLGTPFADRKGENMITSSRLLKFAAGKFYRVATVDWVANNKQNYLGDASVNFIQQPDFRLRAVTVGALNVRAAAGPTTIPATRL